MDNTTQQRLHPLRGSADAKRRNARTVAALTSNSGCCRHAVLDAAWGDKDKLARRVGSPARFGQSQFAPRMTSANCAEAPVSASRSHTKSSSA
jgi:hypothetical protein